MKRTRNLILAGVGLSIALTAIGTFSEDPMEGKSRMSDQLIPWLIILAAVIVVAVICTLLTRRVLAEGKKPGVAALVAAILSLLSNAAFWLGLPSVLAGAAAGWALEARKRGQQGPAVAAYALSGLSVVAAVVLAFTG